MALIEECAYILKRGLICLETESSISLFKSQK